MWDNIQWVGYDIWIAGSIAARSCITVTDGSYMKALYPNIHSAAFVLEGTRGGGQLWGSFSESSRQACSYRGELISLMAIHLILLSVNEVYLDLTGSVEIFSDCLGTLDKVQNFPPLHILLRCSHSNILKNILNNCSDLTFDRYYSHVSAHQDDTQEYCSLTQPLQLNCAMDYMA
jgi:hypothetical protein